MFVPPISGRSHRAIKEHLAMVMMMDYDYIIFVYVDICSYGHW